MMIPLHIVKAIIAMSEQAWYQVGGGRRGKLANNTNFYRVRGVPRFRAILFTQPLRNEKLVMFLKHPIPDAELISAASSNKDNGIPA